MCQWNHEAPVGLLIFSEAPLTRPLAYADDLGLSDTQRDQLLSIIKGIRQPGRQLAAQIKSFADQIDQILLQGSPDPNQIYPLLDQRMAVMNQAERLFVDTIVAGSAVLTQPQKTQLRQIYDDEEAIISSSPYFGMTH